MRLIFLPVGISVAVVSIVLDWCGLHRASYWIDLLAVKVLG